MFVLLLLLLLLLVVRVSRVVGWCSPYFFLSCFVLLCESHGRKAESEALPAERGKEGELFHEKE